MVFPSYALLKLEFDDGFLDDNGLYWYVGNGNITKAQYAKIINHE